MKFKYLVGLVLCFSLLLVSCEGPLVGKSIEQACPVDGDVYCSDGDICQDLDGDNVPETCVADCGYGEIPNVLNTACESTIVRFNNFDPVIPGDEGIFDGQPLPLVHTCENPLMVPTAPSKQIINFDQVLLVAEDLNVLLDGTPLLHMIEEVHADPTLSVDHIDFFPACPPTQVECDTESPPISPCEQTHEYRFTAYDVSELSIPDLSSVVTRGDLETALPGLADLPSLTTITAPFTRGSSANLELVDVPPEDDLVVGDEVIDEGVTDGDELIDADAPVDDLTGGDELIDEETEVIEPLCGNSVIEGSEQCDDGNTLTEACDYGEVECTVCDEFCQDVAGEVAYCGDNIVNGEEQCDSIGEFARGLCIESEESGNCDFALILDGRDFVNELSNALVEEAELSEKRLLLKDTLLKFLRGLDEAR